MPNYQQLIDSADIYSLVVRTPLEQAKRLSKRYNNNIYFKREDLQPVFSFKLRGAFNRISKLTQAELAKGVVAASAGNHAQGVALSAKYFSAKAQIFMPKTTPAIKVDAVRDLGAEVVLIGDTYQEADQAAQEMARREDKVYVHPFNDVDVIAGQGTIAKEILSQSKNIPDVVFVCVGGGGLAAGVSSYIKSMSWGTKVIGVETEDAPSMHAALAAGKPVFLPRVGTFADGTAVKQVGDETFRVCKELLDEVILVDTDALCAAIKDVFEDTRIVLEPSGALAVAGMKAWVRREKAEDKNLVCILSGANINFNRLRHIAERAEIDDNREIILGITIPEVPGSFRRFVTVLGDYNVSEFNYRYASKDAAHVFVGIETHKPEEKDTIINLLKSDGFAVVDLSGSEVAKLHVRHMVGGRNAAVLDERILRFEFPERPGALSLFLEKMNPSWNVTMFHYRSHGSDIGRVLVGIQVPEGDQEKFSEFLKELGYDYFEETDSPAIKLFL